MNIRLCALLSCMLFLPYSIQSTDGQLSKPMQKKIAREISNLESKKSEMGRRFSSLDESRLRRLRKLIAKQVTTPQPSFPAKSLPEYVEY